MKLQVGVKALITNGAGEYLFLERAEALPDGSGMRWDIPGGRIEPEEALIDALRREIQEEIGMNLTGEPELLDAQDIFIPGSELHVVRLTYRAHADGELTMSGEHKAHKWVTLSDAEDLNVDDYLRRTLRTLDQ